MTEFISLAASVGYALVIAYCVKRGLDGIGYLERIANKIAPKEDK